MQKKMNKMFLMVKIQNFGKKAIIISFFLALFLLSPFQITYSQPDENGSLEGDQRYCSINPLEWAKSTKDVYKKNITCDIQHFLNMQGNQGYLMHKDSIFSIQTFANRCSEYPYHVFLLPYRDTIMSIIKTQKNIDFCDYNIATLVGLLDNDKYYRNNLAVLGCANRHVLTKMIEKNTFYKNLLEQLIDSSYTNSNIFYFNSPNLNDTKLSYWQLYNLAQEIIFINDPELNQIFWKAFECRREIPVIFYCGTNVLAQDQGVISLAFAFGAAYAKYFFDPFLFSLLSNPYSVAMVNGVPFDENTYKDYIPIMERYINFVSCQKIKIPFLLKFNNNPLMGKKNYYKYNHYPIPEKYYSLPDTCLGMSNREFPLNFFPPFYYKETEYK